jgi:transcriptional regulator with XRE-family HTH domain
MGKQNDPVSPHAYFAARLRELRAGRRITQGALAEAMASRGFHWHQTTVSRIESGQQAAEFDETVALADIFGVGLGSFLPPEEMTA